MARKTPARRKSAKPKGTRKTSRRAKAAGAPHLAAAADVDLVGQVVGVLRDLSTCVPDGEITPCLDLRIDLCFTDELKRALAAPLQDVARMFDPDARISRDECSELEKVEDASALVAEKAGVDFEKECK